jgi:hypothetical protein
LSLYSTSRPGRVAAVPYTDGEHCKINDGRVNMMNRIVLSLFLAVIAAIPALARADDTRWEVIHVYALADGRSVALAVPAEWQDMYQTRVLGTRSRLRFVDESGAQVEIPAVSLTRASANKPVLWSEDTRKLALKVRKRS